MADLWAFVASIPGWALNNFREVLAYPINPDERIFVIYLFTSFLAGTGVYLVSRFGREDVTGGSDQGLLRFLFPRHVWSTPSAWLDVRYFFLHQILRVFLYGSLAAVITAWASREIIGAFGGPPGGAAEIRRASWIVECGYALISVALLDLTAYLLHYCQHHVPLLWEFHKVHHSARVMHPLTNYREHPVDNIVYASVLAVCSGVTTGLVFTALGYVPRMPTIGGVALFTVAFNALGYNLRHSHVWLRWPDPLAYVFGCPAHHQIHHSYHPTHVNRNFAFMFPVWDLVFGTYELPQTNADVKFGLGETGDEDLTSCARLYWVPFRDAFRSLSRRSETPGKVVEPQPAGHD
jgi:sterol desaturase/sphingolipid hydroxylase (fatty acid hydroxylase superfamily)